MPVFRKRISQSTLTWFLTALATVAMLPSFLIPLNAQAELRAFQLKITDRQTGTDRFVVTRFDHIQYPMYNYVTKSEVVAIEKTWMCYDRSDFLGALCNAPAQSSGQNSGQSSALSPDQSTSGGPGLTDRRPATAAPAAR